MTGQSLLERCRDLFQYLDKSELPERTVTDLRFIVDKELNPNGSVATFHLGDFRVTCKPDCQQDAWEIYDGELDGRVVLDVQGNVKQVSAVRGVKDLEGKKITTKKLTRLCADHTLSRLSDEVDKVKSQKPFSSKRNKSVEEAGAWNVRAALNQLQGMERSCKLAINDLYMVHSKADVAAHLTSQHPLPLPFVGVLSSAMVVCAWYCEVAIKAFHALVREDNTPLKNHSHNLLTLYKALKKDGGGGAIGGWDLDKAVLNAVKSHQKLWEIPAILERPAGIGYSERRPFATVCDIKTSIEKGCRNFV